MPKSKPVVHRGYLQLPNTSLAERIPVGGAAWRRWLKQGDARLFGVETASGTFSASKEERKEGEYWYAYKRRDGRLRKLYIGRDDDLTPQLLNEVCYQINLPDEEFWGDRPADESPQQSVSTPDQVVTSRAALEAIALELLQDAAVTRGGKDRGSVRRGLTAMIERLTDCASAPK